MMFVGIVLNYQADIKSSDKKINIYSGRVLFPSDYITPKHKGIDNELQQRE